MAHRKKSPHWKMSTRRKSRRRNKWKRYPVVELCVSPNCAAVSQWKKTVKCVDTSTVEEEGVSKLRDYNFVWWLNQSAKKKQLLPLDSLSLSSGSIFETKPTTQVCRRPLKNERIFLVGLFFFCVWSMMKAKLLMFYFFVFVLIEISFPSSVYLEGFFDGSLLSHV